MGSISVTKLDGSSELFIAEKVNKVVEHAADGLDVRPSEIVMRAQIQLYDGIPTMEIHSTLIKAAEGLISEEQPDYQYCTARLLLTKIRKEAYGKYTPPDLEQHIQNMVNIGRYDPALLQDYTSEEMEEINGIVDHERDLQYTYAAMVQYQDKYLVKNRVTGKIYESPQMALILIAMGLMTSEDKSVRIQKIKDFYDNVSLMRLSLPTPIMAGVRTTLRQFSSCVLIEAGDDIDQIFAANEAQGKYAAQRAGIGLNFGRIRGTNAPIRGGEVRHSGTVPIVRMYQESLGWTSQGGVRDAAATYFYPMWHWDYQELIVMKNNRGTEQTRARFVDYGVQVNKFLYRRLQSGGNITLFQPNVANGLLYEYFFSDQDKFEELYVELENDSTTPKKILTAAEVWTSFAAERSQTGRIYLQNVDHCNVNGPFIPEVAPVHQSNLCMEITLPTKPIFDLKDPDDEGEIALCTLSAINLGLVEKVTDLKDVCRIAVRSLDNLLDYQRYPLFAAEKTKKRRTLGIGWTNLAYYLAKRGLKYSDGSANNAVHELAEAFQYYLLDASAELAKERGKCELFEQTKYALGILPTDRYKQDVDGLHSAELQMDWEGLRAKIAEYGLRNSTLSAIMPCETSSQITNSTNGIEPPRKALSYKKSDAGLLPVLVPGVETGEYEFKWDMPNPRGYIDIVAIIQKFVDQAVSANIPYKPWSYPGGKLPLKVVLQDTMYAYKHGLKTLYYQETFDGNNQKEEEDDGCSSGACKI